MRSCAKILWSVDLAAGAGSVPTDIIGLRHTLLHGDGKISLLETTKRGLKSPPGVRFGTIQSVPSDKNIEYSYLRAQILDFMLILILIS